MLTINTYTVDITAADLERAWSGDRNEWGLCGPITINSDEVMRFRPREGGFEWDRYDEESGTWYAAGSARAADILALVDNLDDLATLLKMRGLWEAIAPSALPTYGGHWPDATLGVYSWDATRVLTIEGDEIAIMPRVEWEEPEARDMDDDERVGLVRSLRAMRRETVALQVAEMIEGDELRAIMMEAQS